MKKSSKLPILTICRIENKWLFLQHHHGKDTDLDYNEKW